MPREETLTKEKTKSSPYFKSNKIIIIYPFWTIKLIRVYWMNLENWIIQFNWMKNKIKIQPLM